MILFIAQVIFADFKITTKNYKQGTPLEFRSTPYALHPTLYTLRSTPYALRPTPYAPCPMLNEMFNVSMLRCLDVQ